MTKAELIENVCEEAKKRELPKIVVAEVIDYLFSELSKTIKKDKRFSYPGFGTWSVRSRKARQGRNPQTGETIQISASKTVGFRPAPSFKDSL